MLHSGLTGTSSLFEFCPNVAAVAAVALVIAIIVIAEVAVAVGVVAVIVLFVFSRSAFAELFVPIEIFLISEVLFYLLDR